MAMNLDQSADKITPSTGTLTVAGATTSSNTAKAWVNFAGATGAINSSYNVSSVTVNSTANYTVNFTTALPNANYCVQLTIANTSVSTPYAPQVITGGQTTTSSNVVCFATAPTNFNATYFGA